MQSHELLKSEKLHGCSNRKKKCKIDAVWKRFSLLWVWRPEEGNEEGVRQPRNAVVSGRWKRQEIDSPLRPLEMASALPTPSY